MKNPLLQLSKRAASAALFRVPLALLALSWGAGLLCPALAEEDKDTSYLWYTPANGFKTDFTYAKYTIRNQDFLYYYGFDENDNFINGWDESGAPNKDTAIAIETAVQAKYTAARNEEKIEALGKNLDDVLGAAEIEIIKTDPNKGQHSVKYQIAGGSILNSLATEGGLKITDPVSKNIADEKSLHWKIDNTMELKGWATATTDKKKEGLLKNDYKDCLVPVYASGALSYVPIGGIDIGSLDYTSEGKLELYGWRSASNNDVASLADTLTDKTEKSGDNTKYQVVVRKLGTGNNNYIGYADVGSLQSADVNPDTATLVTNALDGSSLDGKLGLRGWSKAADNAIPYKSQENNTLNWLSPPTTTDKAFYLGTDKDAKFGYHELIASSNTTKVAGDKATITTTTDTTTGTTTIGLLGWETAYGTESFPLFLANVGGALAYLPIVFPEDTCTQKWESVAAWVGSTAKNEEKTLTLPKESLAEYLKKEHGMVYSTTVDADLHFDGSTGDIEASFNAPQNWADDSTIKVNENGKYALKTDDPCDTTLTKILDDPSTSTAHSFLALETTSGNLHYVPVGAGLKGGIQPDGVSIVSNETGLAIAGYANASANTVLTRSSSGVEWKSVTADGDGVTITKTADTTAPKLTIVGFENANTNTVLMKSAAGTLEWGAASGGGTITGNTTDSVAIPLSGAVFKSDEYSNVQIKTEIVDGVPTITIGVYYK